MARNSQKLNQKKVLRYIEELKSQNEFKSDLISTSAHQIRTSLTANKWALKEVLDENLGPVTDKQRKILSKLLENNEEMIKSATELIDVNHTEDTHPKYNFGPVDTHKLLENIIQDFHSEAVEKNITISFDETSPKHLIIGDEQKLRTVFQALVENAIKYSNPEDSVMIDIEEDDQNITISVQDEGIGIPDEEQDDIFQKFYRATNAKEKQSIGSGLGLFSAAHIVSAHGGNMWFNSQENVGTTFFVSLPLPSQEVVVE